MDDVTRSAPGPVFLSYSRSDRDAAIAARIALERAGIAVFQDIDGIHAGEDWLARLQEALQRCAAFVVLVGQDGVRRWVGAEVQVAINRRYSAREDSPPLPIYPVLLRGAPADRLPPFLALFQATAWSPEEPLPQALIDGVRSLTVTRAETLRFDGCPFVGLHAFRAKDAHLFFGRGQETLDALAGLGAQQAVHPEHVHGASPSLHHRWLQVEGASGSGKSSLVCAGILPMVERGGLWARTGFDAWRIVGPMLPGADPVDKLAEVLEHALVPAPEVRNSLARLQGLQRDDDALRRTLRDAHRDDEAFLLVVDQFEELFTLSDPRRRARFDALLAAALEDPQCPMYLVSTIRSDFLDRFELLPRLQALANRTCKRYLLPLASEDGLREVIERPAQLAGLDVREVTGAILEDARDEVGALPLVQNALFVLWTVREGHRLSGAAYRRLGGIAGMLSAQADELLDRVEAQVPGGRVAALELLLRLTRVGDEGRHTRQRITRREAVLVAGDGDEARGETVVRLLSGEAEGADAGAARRGVLRLITTAGGPDGMPRPGAAGDDSAARASSVDLIHETLIRGRGTTGAAGQHVPYWPTLYQYVEKNRHRDLDRQQLRMRAQDWAARGRLARWRGLPGWSDLRRYRRLRPAPGSPEAGFVRQAMRAARLRLGAWAALACMAAVVGESLVWSRQLAGLAEYPQLARANRWPLAYALYRPLWLVGWAPEPELLRIDGGSFRMGCVPGRDDRAFPCWDDELHPDGQTAVAGPLWLARRPVSYREYDAYVFQQLRQGVDGLNYPYDRSGARDDAPVTQIDWHQAAAYAEWLGRRRGQACRLPTEAEWEFVARTRPASGAAELPAGVAEWVGDAYGPYRDAAAGATADVGADVPRVVRGAALLDEPAATRIHARAPLAPSEIAGSVGFRVVCIAAAPSVAPAVPRHAAPASGG